MSDSLTFRRSQQPVELSAVYTVTNKMSELYRLASEAQDCINESLSSSNNSDCLSNNLNKAKSCIENMLKVLEPELNSHATPTGSDEPEEGGLDKSDFV